MKTHTHSLIPPTLQFHLLDYKRAALNTDGNAALQTIQTVEKFGDVAEVDFSFVSAPTFASSYLTLNAKGEFYSQTSPQVSTSCVFTLTSDLLTGTESILTFTRKRLIRLALWQTLPMAR